MFEEVKDLNKDITGITYNYLNLPKQVTFGNGNQVSYVYDAAGTKLQKTVTESGSPTKTTNYAGGLIYEGTTDKFLNIEEGRIVLKEDGTTKTEYQYHLKDHLGNVRLTFTTVEGGITTMYMATMETDNAEYEEQAFANVAETRQVDKLYNHTDDELTTTGTANASARLNAAEDRAMGPWTNIRVMPGDTVRMTVYAKYDQPTKTREAVTGMAGIIAATVTGGAGDIDGLQQVTREIGETLKGGQAALLAKDNHVPKAYLNYIFFDKEMKSKATNFRQVTEAAHGSFEQLDMEYIAEEEGYLMAYTTNETNEDLNVFMDDFTIMHTSGPIVRVDDYYPFGMVYGTSELDNKLTNKFLFNGKEKEELTDWYDYGARMYMSDIGRWGVVDPLSELYFHFSPYHYTLNNPISNFDPNGMSSINILDIFNNAPKGLSSYDSEGNCTCGCPGKPPCEENASGEKTRKTSTLFVDPGNVDFSNPEEVKKYKEESATAKKNVQDLTFIVNFTNDVMIEAGTEVLLFTSGGIAVTGVLRGGRWVVRAYQVNRLRQLGKYVNLASKSRTTHILYGDATGGGHMWSWSTLFNSKSKFPITWSKEKIMHAVSEIATSGEWIQQTGKAGQFFTKAGKPARFYTEGVFEGTRIKVILEPTGEGIITAFPR